MDYLKDCAAGNADETLQILDLASLDMSLNLGTATSVASASSNASSKNIFNFDKTGKELSCYATDFSSVNEMDLAFVGSSLDQSSVVTEDESIQDEGESIIEAKTDGVVNEQPKDEDLAESLTEAPSMLPINTDDFLGQNQVADSIEVGDLIQLSDSIIDPVGYEPESQSNNKPEQHQEPDMITDAVAISEEVELIKFDDTADLHPELENSTEVSLSADKENCDSSSSSENAEKSSSVAGEQNSSNGDEENQQPVAYEDTDEVFCPENASIEQENENEEVDEGVGEVKLLDITNFVFSSPLPPSENSNKSLGNNSSLNLMDMSLSKLGKDENKDKFSTPKPCLKLSSNTSGDDSSVSRTTSYSRRKSKSVSFQSPGIYFSNVKRLSVIRKTPITRRSVNRTSAKTLKTPDSVTFNKMVKFSTPNKMVTTPCASPLTTMVNKFSRLALVTPPSSKMNESRPMNEEFSSINLILTESCDTDQSENSTNSTNKSDNSEHCLRI